eukprot:scaffold27136_cov118-Isochrysis_galbana.AAC.6
MDACTARLLATPSPARRRLSTNATAGAWAWGAGAANAGAWALDVGVAGVSVAIWPGARVRLGAGAPPDAMIPAPPADRAMPGVACRMAWAVRRSRHRVTSDGQSCGVEWGG